MDNLQPVTGPSMLRQAQQPQAQGPGNLQPETNNYLCSHDISLSRHIIPFLSGLQIDQKVCVFFVCKEAVAS